MLHQGYQKGPHDFRCSQKDRERLRNWPYAQENQCPRRSLKALALGDRVERRSIQVQHDQVQRKSRKQAGSLKLQFLIGDEY